MTSGSRAAPPRLYWALTSAGITLMLVAFSLWMPDNDTAAALDVVLMAAGFTLVMVASSVIRQWAAAVLQALGAATVLTAMLNGPGAPWLLAATLIGCLLIVVFRREPTARSS